MKITKEKAEELFLQDCEKAIKNVNSFMSKYNFNQNQFDALVSFAFNVGSINQLTASGTRTLEQISSKITAYNKSGGRVIAGLVKRRAKEKELFDTPTSTTVKKSNEEIAKEVVAENDGQQNRGQHKDYIQLPMLAHINQRVMQSGCFARFFRGACHCSFHLIPPFFVLPSKILHLHNPKRLLTTLWYHFRFRLSTEI